MQLDDEGRWKAWVYTSVLKSSGRATVWHSGWDSLWDSWRPNREGQNVTRHGKYSSVFRLGGFGFSF